MTYRPHSGAPVVAGIPPLTGIFKRQAWLILLVFAVALAAAPSALATPGSVSGKRAEAQAVLGQIQGLDANLEHAVEAYNLANQKLAHIEGDLRENKLELRLARSNLRHAQATLSARLVEMYTSGGENTGLEILSTASARPPYSQLSEIEYDAFNARIWGGLHYRKAMTDAYELGHSTAARVLAALG